MYHRVTIETALKPYNNISHIQSILCFITTATRSVSVKMFPPQQNVVIYQKNEEINKTDNSKLIFNFFYQRRDH